MTLGGPKRFLLKNREKKILIFMSCMTIEERLKYQIDLIIKHIVCYTEEMLTNIKSKSFFRPLLETILACLVIIHNLQ